MTLADFINAIRGDYSIIITKKDGSFSDECAIVCLSDPMTKYREERSKARKIAERTDLAIDAIIAENGKDLLISLKEV